MGVTVVELRAISKAEAVEFRGSVKKTSEPGLSSAGSVLSPAVDLRPNRDGVLKVACVYWKISRSLCSENLRQQHMNKEQLTLR